MRSLIELALHRVSSSPFSSSEEEDTVGTSGMLDEQDVGVDGDTDDPNQATRGHSLMPNVRSSASLSTGDATPPQKGRQVASDSQVSMQSHVSLRSSQTSLRSPTLAGWDATLFDGGAPQDARAGTVGGILFRDTSPTTVAEAMDVADKDVVWPLPQPGNGDGYKRRDVRAARAFRHRLKLAWHIGLAALLATGISVVYPWSENLTWFGIVMSITGVGRNVGHTLQGTKDSWTGAALAVPLCLLLGLGIFSRILTGFLVAFATIMIVACKGLPESSKKVALIFVIWDVLIPAVAEEITIIRLLVNLLKAVFGGNIIANAAVLLPVPQLAVWDVCVKLEELTSLMQSLVETYVTIFCMQDREVKDLEEMLDQCHTLLSEARALLPDVRMELRILRSSHAYSTLTKYLDSLEGQLETLAGMALSLSDIPPNSTHVEYVKQMSKPMARLLRELQQATNAATEYVCSSIQHRNPYLEHSNLHTDAELLIRPKEALQQCLRGVLRARMRVVYGREVGRDETSGEVVFRRSASAEEAAQAFMNESRRLGYMNLLPRNTFVLDLALYVEATQGYDTLLPVHAQRAEPAVVPVVIDDSKPSAELKPPEQPLVHKVWAFVRRNVDFLLPSGEWLQPCKVALAVAISSAEVLVDNPSLGLQTIWGPLTVATTMSSHPASSFRSGVNRVLGTVMGATYGMALMEWLKVRDHTAIVLLLTLWVLFCGLHRTSKTYGEAAVSAALTAPIIVVGPVLGSSGLVVRNMQIMAGTVTYVVVDNLCWPKRAKISVREELVTSVRAFKAFWLDELTVFATEVDPLAIERGKAEAERLRRSLKREETFIKLAADEPELWHKPFPLRSYSRVLAAQWRIFRLLLMLHRSSMTFPMELAAHDQAMLSSLQSVLQRLKDTTLTVFSEALARLQSLQMPAEDVPPLLSLSGLRQEFHRIETDTDAFIEEFFSQDPVLTAIDFIVPLNGMIYSTRKLSTELLVFSQAVKELVDRERG